MFPNPQDALPLPPRPNLEQYKKLSKDLVKACRQNAANTSTDNSNAHDDEQEQRDAISDWVLKWLETLARLQGFNIPEVREQIDNQALQVEEFIRRRLSTSRGEGKSTLADAQFIIARSHGFLSWRRLAQHIQELSHASSQVSDFEAAADAIIHGEIEELTRLLRDNPKLIRARSTREHNATLLHYVSANGVENFRQKTPSNIVEITSLLLKAGAEVDATAMVYRGACTTLELVATSIHPLEAGTQNVLIEKLLDCGAEVDGAPGGPGMIIHCLKNGCPQAAELLTSRGAKLTLEGAAAMGRLDILEGFFKQQERQSSGRDFPHMLPDGVILQASNAEQLTSGFLLACAYGRTSVVGFLLQKGIDIATRDRNGQTGLHWAAIGGHLDTIKLLLDRQGPLEVTNIFGGTVLGQTVWSAAHGGDPDTYVHIIETLIAAGARVADRHPPVNAPIDALLERYGSQADERLTWFGEKRKKRNDALSES